MIAWCFGNTQVSILLEILITDRIQVPEMTGSIFLGGGIRLLSWFLS